MTLYIVDAYADRHQPFDRYYVRSQSQSAAKIAVKSFVGNVDAVEVEVCAFQNLHIDLPEDTPLLAGDGRVEFIARG